MAEAVLFQIESGEFGLAVVDKTAPGYLETWQAPGGATADVVTIEDYDAGAATWTCQVSSGALTATANVNTLTVEATWCAPGKNIPQPQETSYTWDMTFYQDPQVDPVDSLNRFLFQYDTQECYLYASMNGGDAPKVIGRVRLVAGTIGGAGRTPLTADASIPFARKPDVMFGSAAVWQIIAADGTVTDGPVVPLSASQPENVTA